ncbi:glycosyl hydrolase family 28-related protein [Psychrobacillus sp. FJAT-51614]|uniref:Glycosyl hydrolase family 28-related protein n=1 Tax=Psychrobacillus mangrovi TaxID=3117745 RepID=A0ABU8F791_9BACI
MIIQTLNGGLFIKNTDESDIKLQVQETGKLQVLETDKLLETYEITPANFVSKQDLNESAAIESPTNVMVYENTPTLLQLPGGATLDLATLARTERLENVVINVKDFGATGDGFSNDTAAIKNAIAYANSKEGSTLFFPHATSYWVDETIYIPSTISVKMDTLILYGGNLNEPCLVIGGPDLVTSNKTYEIRVRRSLRSDWSDENCIGVKAVNLDTSHLRIFESQNFTIGVQTIGVNKGFAYSTITLGRIINNKIALDVTNEGTGWCNDNIFDGGRISVNSTVHKDKSRYGIRVTSKLGYRNNNNIFNKPAVEMGTPTTGESIAILVEYGVLNKFKDVRSEGNNLTIARFTNQSSKNLITVGYSSILTRIEDLSTRGGNTLTNPQIIASGSFKAVYSIPNLHKKVTPYDSVNPTRQHVSGLLGKSNTSKIATKYVANSTIQSDHLEVTNSALGIFVNTENTKEFVVGGERLRGFGGRGIVIGYGEDGSQLLNDFGYVVGLEDMSMNYSTNSGGRYQTGADNERSVYFKLHANVKKIFVGFASGANALKMRSFYLHALFEELPPSVDITPNTNFDERLALTKPTAGTFVQGDFVRNDAPTELGTEGSKYMVTGWTYTVADTWVENRSLTGN